MKQYSLYFLFSVVSLFGFSNDVKSIVKGKIVDENNVGIPYASVALLSVSDSSVVTGTATLDDGSFEFSAEKGTYFLRVTFLSYQEKWINHIIVEGKAIDLGNIILSPSTNALEDVVIEAERSQMELKLDKRVFNVGKDLSNLGGSASDILDNIPSIQVDTDGNVSLRGSQNVRILIDGKPSGLMGSDPASALKMIQGDMIDRVEIITNPSARYDAEGEAGIVNIILKKEERKGINGSVTINGGLPKNHGGALAVNYRTKNANYFTNFSINDKQSPGKGFINQSFSTADTSYVFQQERNHSRGGFSQSIQAGTDLFLNKKNTLTLSGLYRNGNADNFSTLIYRDFNQANILTQTVTRTEDETETTEDVEAALSYAKTFNSDEHKLTFDAKFIRNIDFEASDFDEVSDNENLSAIEQRGVNTENEENIFIQSDYVLPLGEDKRFEAGARSSLRFIENAFTVEQLNDNNEFVAMPEFDDIMQYNENIHAAYSIFGNKVKTFSYQVGLRAEYSDITTNLVKSNQINPRDYINLFPSVHLSKELQKENSLQLSYSRRISRPSLWNLLPFFTFSDSRRFFSGNPNLNPEFTNAFEAGHLKYWEKASLLSSVYYRRGTGVIERITTVDEEGFTRIFPINLAVKNSFGVEFNMSKDLTSWWKITTSGNFFRAIVNGDFEGQNFYADTYGWNGKFSSKTTMFKKLDTQVSFDYRSPERTTQGTQKSMYFLNLGASMDVLKGNGTISFSAQDIFNTRKRRWETFGEGFYSESEFQWRSRQFILSFNYRINQKKKKEERGGFGGEGGGEF
ncbi:MAG: TonB-dependent receptor domain-containing protein [Bacteroidia bacterium]